MLQKEGKKERISECDCRLRFFRSLDHHKEQCKLKILRQVLSTFLQKISLTKPMLLQIINLLHPIPIHSDSAICDNAIIHSSNNIDNKRKKSV